jgi:Fic family protein
MMSLTWIWQRPEWPRFTWNNEALSSSLREVIQLQGKLLGKIEHVPQEAGNASVLDAQLQNIIQSSAIEGEHLNAESVRSSLAKRLGVKDAGLSSATAQTEGLADLLLDATQNYKQALSLDRLFQWHTCLFTEQNSNDFSLQTIKVGQLRGDELMQVVSGPHQKRTVHFQAPPRDGLEEELNVFLAWLNTSRDDKTLDPILRAAQAHLWFVTLHPFDDGNGRLARAVSDYALAQGEQQSIRYYAMAASIMENRKAYYEILERTQKSDMDITAWMNWFLATLRHTLEAALVRIDMILRKSRFWQLHGQDGLKPEQTKVLNRLLDAGPDGFEGGLTAGKYQRMAKVSKATATRHITDLLEKQCICKLEGGGRSTHYEINWP